VTVTSCSDQTIGAASASSNGILTLTFHDHQQIVVEPADASENWQVLFSEGRMLVACAVATRRSSQRMTPRSRTRAATALRSAMPRF
jgi:hypothetical protein